MSESLAKNHLPIPSETRLFAGVPMLREALGFPHFYKANQMIFLCFIDKS